MPRTPNPPPGARLPFLNHKSVVDRLAAERRDLLDRSCQDHGGSWDFMDELVRRLREIDTRYGYNGKRGNAGDPSHDAIAYNYSSDPDDGTTNVYIIDVIGGHCGGNPQPAWIDQTEETRRQGTIGRWMWRRGVPRENTPGPPPPPPPPPPTPTPEPIPHPPPMTDLSPLLAELAHIRVRLAEIREVQDKHTESIAKTENLANQARAEAQNLGLRLANGVVEGVCRLGSRAGKASF